MTEKLGPYLIVFSGQHEILHAWNSVSISEQGLHERAVVDHLHACSAKLVQKRGDRVVQVDLAAQSHDAREIGTVGSGCESASRGIYKKTRFERRELM